MIYLALSVSSYRAMPGVQVDRADCPFDQSTSIMVCTMKKLLLFFVDGIGLGEDDERINPLRDLFCGLMDGHRFVRRNGSLYFRGGVLVPTDPVMGTPGIPQSATGQTSIFTGVNAQNRIGYHLMGYPNDELKIIIEERSLMKALVQRGVRVTAANLYSQEFFDKRRNSSRNLFPGIHPHHSSLRGDLQVLAGL